MWNTIIGDQGTKALANELASGLKPGAVIGLIGDLGAGKTTLTRYIAEALEVEDRPSCIGFRIRKSSMN